MRKGVLLSEAPPLDIMASCNVDTLESAFLILSQKQSPVTHNVMVGTYINQYFIILNIIIITIGCCCIILNFIFEKRIILFIAW